MDIEGLLIKILLSFAVLAAAKLTRWLVDKSIDKIDKYAEKNGLSALDISTSTKRSISQFLKYIVYTVAFLIILYIFGLNDLLAGILTAAGVSGIAIGFAAKDLISNALSGIILIFDRPFGIGDYVKIGKLVEKGTVQSIGIRKTIIKSRDGMIITVPNSLIVNQTVINYSKSRTRLIELTLGVDINSSVRRALSLIDGVLDKLEWKKGDSEVYVSDVTKDNVILTIKAWTALKEYGEHKAELFKKIRNALVRGGISFYLKE